MPLTPLLLPGRRSEAEYCGGSSTAGLRNEATVRAVVVTVPYITASVWNVGPGPLRGGGRHLGSLGGAWPGSLHGWGVGEAGQAGRGDLHVLHLPRGGDPEGVRLIEQ